MSSVGKGIYLQLLSRLLKKQGEVVESTPSSSPVERVRNVKAGTGIRSRPVSATKRASTNKSRPSSAIIVSSTSSSSASSPSVLSQQNKQADDVLRFAFHRFKVGDRMAAQKAIKKILSRAPRASAIHFSAQLCLSLGHLCMKEYEEVVRTLSEVISLCGQNMNGLCDALIILAEAYSAVGLLDEALHSARLAVDVAHDKLETHQKPEVVHTKSIILLSSNPNVQVGPMLDTSTALVAAYYTLASQLFNNGYLSHSVDWYNRAATTCKDFGLDEPTCKYLTKVKESAKRAQKAQERSVRDEKSDKRKKTQMNQDDREMKDDGNVESIMSRGAISGRDMKSHVDTGVRSEENFDDDDVPIDEDNSDNVDQEIDATVEENTYNFYKPRRERLSEEAKSQSSRVLQDNNCEGAVLTKDHINAINIDNLEEDGKEWKKNQDNKKIFSDSANSTTPTTPDATSRPSSKSKRIRSAKVNDKNGRQMSENYKAEKENLPAPKAPWKPSGTFNPNVKSPAEVIKEEVKAVKNKIKAAAYDTGGMDLDKLFDRIDGNNNGTIQSSELEYEVKHLLPGISRSHLRKFIDSVDEDHNGSLDKQEFINFILDVKDNINKSNAHDSMKKASQTPKLTKQRSESNFSKPKLVRTRSLPLFIEDEKQASVSKGKHDDTKHRSRKSSLSTKERNKPDNKRSIVSATTSTADEGGNNTATDSILNQQPFLFSEDEKNYINDENDDGKIHNQTTKKPSKLTDKYATDITNAEKMYSDRCTQSVVRIQAASRRYIAKKRVRAIRQHEKFERRRKLMRMASVKIQKVGRGYIGRQKVEKKRKLMNSIAATNEQEFAKVSENVSDSEDHVYVKEINCGDTSQMLAEEMAELLALREQMKKHREENPDHFMSPMQHKFGAFGTIRELDPTKLVAVMPPTPVIEATSKLSTEGEQMNVSLSPSTTLSCPVSTSVSTITRDNDDSSVAVEPPTPTTLSVQDGFVVRIDVKQQETSSQRSAVDLTTQEVDWNDTREVNSLGEDGKHDPEKFNKIFDRSMGGNFASLVANVPPTVIVPSPEKTKNKSKPVVEETLIITPLPMREMPVHTSISTMVTTHQDNDVSLVPNNLTNTSSSTPLTTVGQENENVDVSGNIRGSNRSEEEIEVENGVVANITEALSGGFRDNISGEAKNAGIEGSLNTGPDPVYVETVDESERQNDVVIDATKSLAEEDTTIVNANNIAEIDAAPVDIPMEDRMVDANPSAALLSSAPYEDKPINVLDTPVDEPSPVNIPIRVVERPAVYPAISNPSITFQPAQSIVYSNTKKSTAIDAATAENVEDKFLGGVLTSQPGNIVPPRNLALHKNKMLTADEMRKEFDTDMHIAIKTFGYGNIDGSPVNVAPITQVHILPENMKIQTDLPTGSNDQSMHMISSEQTVQESTPKAKKRQKKRGVMFAENIEDVKVIPNTVIGEEEARSLKEIASKKISMNIPVMNEKVDDKNSTRENGSVIGSPPLARVEKKERRGERSRGTIISSSLLSPASSTSSSHRDQLASSRSVPTQQEEKQTLNLNDINDGDGAREADRSFTDDESSTFYTNNSDYYYNESMTPNTLTTYGENTPMKFDDLDSGAKSNEEDIDRFVHIKENERQNKHFESWLSSDARV